MSLQSIKIPSLYQGISADLFFKELIKANRGRRGFSQRAFSSRLKWPPSYIPDIIKRRKKFTVPRAIQLSRYLSMDPLAMEKLILLAIDDMGLIGVAEKEKMQNLKSARRSAATKDAELLDARVLLVFECVRWLKGTATVPQLLKLTSRQGFTAAEVSRHLKLLTSKKCIFLKGGKYHAIAEPLFSDDFGVSHAEIHLQFLAFLKNFFDQQIGPALYNSSIVHLERFRTDEVMDKIVGLRNWIHELSVHDEKTSSAEDVRLYQIDFNLTPIFGKELAKKMQVRK